MPMHNTSSFVGDINHAVIVTGFEIVFLSVVSTDCLHPVFPLEVFLPLSDARRFSV